MAELQALLASLQSQWKYTGHLDQTEKTACRMPLFLARVAALPCNTLQRRYLAV